jgi:hypothetical protein
MKQRKSCLSLSKCLTKCHISNSKQKKSYSFGLNVKFRRIKNMIVLEFYLFQ